MSHKIKKFSTKFDDLGIIIMGNRCSIQQGEENNCWLEQSPEKSNVSTVPLFLGHPVYIYLFRAGCLCEFPERLLGLDVVRGWTVVPLPAPVDGPLHPYPVLGLLGQEWLLELGETERVEEEEEKEEEEEEEKEL